MAGPQRPEERDPFAVLGVSRDCTPETLHRAYRALARRYHPDVNGDASAAEQMRRINAAFVAARRQLHTRAAARISITMSTKPGPPSTPAPTSGPRTPVPPAARASQPGRESRPSVSPSTTAPVAEAGSHEPASSASGEMARVPRATPTHPFKSTYEPSGLAGHTTVKRTGVRRIPWSLWGLGVLILAGMPVVLLLLASHSGWLGGGHHNATPNMPAFALGRSTTLQWPGLGSVVLSERAIAQLPAMALSDPSWSYDGQYLALTQGDASGQAAPSSQASITIFNASGQQERTFPGFAARWSPRADQLAILVMPTGASAPELDLADVVTGTERLLVPRVSVHIAWSPGGNALLFSADSLRGLRLVDLQTMRTTLIYDAPASDATHILALGWFSANTVLCLQTNGPTTRMVLIDTGTGQLTPLPPTLKGSKQAVAWNTARQQVLFMAQAPGQTPSAPLLLDRASGAIQALPGLRGMTTLAGWSADNQWLAGAQVTTTSGGANQSTLCLMALPTPLPSAAWTTRCVPIPGAISGLRWDRGGARLTYLRTLTPQTGEELRELTITRVTQSPTARASAANSRGKSAGA